MPYGQIGLDAKAVLKDKFVLDATANPDFSQVESDEPQVTVNQRFEVQFPEKRPFFLENSNYFQTPIPAALHPPHRRSPVGCSSDRKRRTVGGGHAGSR